MTSAGVPRASSRALGTAQEQPGLAKHAVGLAGVRIRAMDRVFE